MSRTYSTLALVTLSTGFFGLVSAQPFSAKEDSPAIPHPYWWEGPSTESLKQRLYESQTSIPLPTLPPMKEEPSGSGTSILATVVETPTPSPSNELTSNNPSSIVNWSPSNSFYVSPIPLPSTAQVPPTPPVSSAAGYTSPLPVATSVVPLPASSVVSWSPSNSFYVEPIPLPSNVEQSSLPSPSAIYGSLVPSAGASYLPPPPAALTSALPLHASSPPSGVAQTVVQTPSFTPGVVPSFTPGVIPSYTPGLVPSYTQSVGSLVSSVPAIPSSARFSVLPSQSVSSGLAPSASLSPTSVPTTLVATSSSAPSAASSVSTSVASAASSITSVVTSLVTPSQSSASAPSSAAVSPRPSSSGLSSANIASASAGSTLSATTIQTASANSQGTGIPPAPSAGSASGSLGVRGKERVCLNYDSMYSTI
ncbi:hypothetical protein GQ44DRAFT_448900 [Phaeosphaeriaceae sp. PMI808]|nr:hypothetical protein GQ44DRAFT_448900 [Phaeosphaeriaceae sp. PMI808]